MTLVRMAHMRSLHYCARGVREFFVRHGLDYSDFLQNGISSEKLRATGDSMAIRVAEAACGRKQ